MDNNEASTVATPRLWNPNAAANWSLLFTPILGAWLHSKNWKELGQQARAKRAIIWAYVSFVFQLAILFLPDNVGSAPALIFLFVWYFSSAKGQVKYLKKNNINYEKKTWAKPLLLGVAGLVVYILAASTFLSVFEPSRSLNGFVESCANWLVEPSQSLKEVFKPSRNEILESNSVNLVNKILIKNLGEDVPQCTDVSITEEQPDGFYYGVAHLDNGNELKITIELEDDQILVTIPPQ